MTSPSKHRPPSLDHPDSRDARIDYVYRVVDRWRRSREMFGKEALRVRDKETFALVPFIDRPVQYKLEQTVARAEAEMHTDPKRPLRIAILKARKEGVTSWIQKFLFHRTMFWPGIEACTICHEREASENVLRISRRFHQYLPNDFRPGLSSDARGMMEWEHDSRIIVKTAGTPEGVRSYSYSIIHSSEYAFWPDAERSLAALAGAMPDSSWTYMFYESTANGTGNHFYEMWQGAIAKGRAWNGCVPLFFSWFDDPSNTVETAATTIDYTVLTPQSEALRRRHNLTLGQALWYQRKLMSPEFQGDITKMHQEFPSTHEEAFVASGGSVFSGPSVEALARLAAPRPKYHLSIMKASREWELLRAREGPIEVWEAPSPDGEYVVGIDTAAGAERDRSICDVWRRLSVERMTQVACLSTSALIPSEFAKVVLLLLKMYAKDTRVDPLVVPEIDSLGREVVTILQHEGWTRFYRRDVTPEFIPANASSSFTIGYVATPITKPQLVETFRFAVQEGRALAQSHDLIAEMRMFEQARTSGGMPRYGAPSGGTDDRVVAAALAWLGHSKLPAPKLVEKEKALEAPRTRGEAEARAVWDRLKEKRARERHDATWEIDSILGRLRRGPREL